MYGKVIGTSIAVDCFHEVTKNGIYFLTEGHIKDAVPVHVDRIYTSPYNAWLLSTRFQMDPEKIVSLPVNEKLLIQDKVKKLDFYVTLLDAKQKPGAVMFLFEGESIGNILYAGKCCYDDRFFSRPLCNFLKSKVLDYLYVHDVCEDCHNHSIPMCAAIEEIVNRIGWNPDSRVVVNEPCFREDILTALQTRLRKPICVSQNIMKHLDAVGRGTDFTLDQTGAALIVTDEPYSQRKVCGMPVSRILLVPCSMKKSSQELQEKLTKLDRKGHHVIIYRNHCSPPELVSLARDINAKHTVLVRPLPLHPAYGTNRNKDLDFWSHLGNFQRFIEFLSNFQSEMEESDTSKEVFENNVSDEELQNAVNGILDKEDDPDMRNDKSADDIHSGRGTPNSFILIESDIDSVIS